MPAKAFDPLGVIAEALSPIGYQRATTLKSMIEDTTNLTGWSCRMTLIGAASRSDITAETLLADPTDRKKLNALVEKAKEAGGATIRRDLGTAVHKFLELKCADPSYKVPEPYAATVQAILSAIDMDGSDEGYDVVVEYSEKILVVDSIAVAGMCDLVLRHRRTGELFIADLKTGSSVKYGVLGFSCQLTTYAMADNIYIQGAAKDGSEDRRLPMPEVSQTVGIIIHCEPESNTAQLYRLRLDREIVDLAVAVRAWRKEKDLLVPFVSGDKPTNTAVPGSLSGSGGGSVEEPQPAVPAPVTSTEGEGTATLEAGAPSVDNHAARVAWAFERIDAIREAGHVKTLGTNWDEDVPKPAAVRAGEAAWSPEQLEWVLAKIDATEARWEMTFGAPDPAVAAAHALLVEKLSAEPVDPPRLPEVDDGDDWASEEQVTGLRTLVRTMHEQGDPNVQRVTWWQKDGAGQHRPWALGKGDQRTSMRRYHICLAALELVSLIDDTSDDPEWAVRALLAFVIGDDALMPIFRVGGLLGSLTTEQAQRIALLAETHRVAISDDGSPQLTAVA